VKPDHLGLLAFFEVAVNGVAHLLVKAGKIIRFSEDGLPQSSRRVSALWRFFHQEDQFTHTVPQLSSIQYWAGVVLPAVNLSETQEYGRWRKVE
jgi:hypothetical protein